ncbi:type I polyketide synthase [Streptomyces sp. NPDC021224]|uniref:type I polyketide synthase n=1 Tax=unclassified Streptomyces TaxID=2593676 RepID=UPI0037A8F5F7
MADEEKLRQYLKKATGDLRVTARKLQEAELKDTEPIAIVGMGCRFPPGLRSPEGLWDFVAGEGDGITPFPGDRGWGPDAGPGGSPDKRPDEAARQGGFLGGPAGADRFDAGFFGITPHEALVTDPQQRLLLETAWDAVEHAGIDPAGLRGTRTGVYAGVSYCHYGAGPQPELPEGGSDQQIIGGAPSTASGRVAYALGLHGPALSIDTACSSSLVAIHLACQALRRGDCDLALAGGVTVMATPNVILEFGRRGALAGDGRCKPFAAGADGMGFGEGAGLLVLERLSAARRHGHSVLAVVRGSAVNQDGATNGLTSPSRSAQEAVIRQALDSAGLAPDQVDAVEGHGTGTALGDAIEAEAVIATYGADRPQGRPLRLGSVKSNIGHTQTASGVASVIKIVMSMRAGIHARTLNIDHPTTYVDWSAGSVVLTTEATPWPSPGRPRRAGVSSFGISGTNAHLIVEEPAAPDGAETPPGPAGGTADGGVPWVVSAKDAGALRAVAGELGEFLDARPGVDVAGVGRALARTRGAFAHRAVVVGPEGDSPAARRAALAALARGEAAPGLLTGTATGTGGTPTALLLTGDVPGAVDAARELAARFPVFAEAHAEVLARLAERLGAPPAGYRQAAVFAWQTAMVRLVRSFGVEPEVVAGAGIGEIAAACAAGVLSSADAVALAAAAARADADTDALRGDGDLSPADATALAAAAARADENAGALRAAAEGVAYGTPARTLVLASGGAPDDPERWATGGFLAAGGDAPAAAREQGAAVCLELDPGAVTGVDELLARLAAAWTAGTAVRWAAAFDGPAGPGEQVRLPGYPFRRSRYWLASPALGSHGPAEPAREDVHPLLGGEIDLADPAERRFARSLTARESWYAGQYRLRGAAALPSAALAEWALAAARHGAGDGVDPADVRTVEDLDFGPPVLLTGARALPLQTAAETRGATRRVRGFTAQAPSPARPADDAGTPPEPGSPTGAAQAPADSAGCAHPATTAPGARTPDPAGPASPARPRWTLRFSACAAEKNPPAPSRADLGRLRERLAEGDPGVLFGWLDAAGVGCGPVYREAARRSWRGDDEVLALLETGAEGGEGYVLHPVVFELCLLAAAPLLADAGRGAGPWLPSAVARLTCHRELPARVWCHARRAGDGTAHVELYDDAGEPLVSVAGLAFAPAELPEPPRQDARDTGGDEPWDAGELARLAVEEPRAARLALTDTLFARVSSMVGAFADDPASVRTRFPASRLGDLGLDSLRAMRLREQFRTGLHVDVPPQKLLGEATVADVVDLVCRDLAARSLVVTGDEEPAAGEPLEELIL